MPDNSATNKRIAKNTLMLYFRMLLLMLVSLYTSRVILNALGIEDYGIYNIVGGVVGMFAVVSGSFSSAIGRFLTFAMGKGDVEGLKRVFSTSITVQGIISVIIVILGETVGLWYVNSVMVVPDGRLMAANWCYQFSIFTFVVNLLSVPYNAAITAHEKMSAFAYISIVDAIGRLAIAFLIQYNPFDQLIYYGLLLMLYSLFIRMLYTIYCHKHFNESHFNFVLDKPLIKEMFSFAGWNFFGAGSRVLRDSGGNMLLNFYFGPVVNAARGISNSVSNAVAQFGQNFVAAMNPQITKSYANGNHEYMFKLIFTGSRLTVYMLLMLSTPIILNTPFILKVWLKTVPDHAVLFTQLVLVYEMVEIMSYPLVTSMLATGKIRNYQIVVGGLQCMNIPLAWLLLHYGCIPEMVVIVSIFIAHCCFIARLIMLRGMIGLKAQSFFTSIYLRILLVALIGYVIPLGVHLLLDYGWVNLIITTLVALITMGLSILFVGCNVTERNFIYSKAKEFVSKLKSRDKHNG